MLTALAGFEPAMEEFIICGQSAYTGRPPIISFIFLLLTERDAEYEFVVFVIYGQINSLLSRKFIFLRVCTNLTSSIKYEVLGVSDKFPTRHYIYSV